MGMKDYFHMVSGDGELSYSQNSSVQKQAWLLNQHILETAIQSLISSEESAKTEGLHVVDLGCGVGPVPLALVSLVVDVMQRKCKELNRDKIPKLVMYMNDLPSNDFNLLFKDLMKLEALKGRDNYGVPSCFVMGAPGSYYDRLFPNNTLHFVHANYTLHWLSQVPPGIHDEQGIPLNKGNIYLSETCPKEVAKAYFTQFEQDLTHFIKLRSEEMVHNGCMLMTLRGRPCPTDSLTWTSFELKLITEALTCLVSEGLIKEEKVDSFNMPCYHASTEQLESIVKKEGSFEVEDSKTSIFDVVPEIEDTWEKAQVITKFIRAFSESILSSHFGKNIMSPLYDKLLDQVFNF
ncbi:Caffeine synthase 1 [Bienertia sinuspersici]